VVDSRSNRHVTKVAVTATPVTRVQLAAEGDQTQRVLIDPDITVLIDLKQ
jgi:hypothetical protein